MTFKHVKFEDSPTMRSLEKVAKEKGLVKPEALRKSASIPKKADYTPSSDLMENIFKLCAGLRSQGLEKEASEIETNYLNYKRAQTLYETSTEKGEDLVHDAHPKGSHKLEGVEGDAVVEDILEQHMKMIQMVEKKPTGKLSNAQALREVKRALADAPAPAPAPAAPPSVTKADVTTKLSTETYTQLKNQTDQLDDKINSWALLPGSGTTDDTEMKTDSLISYIRSTLLSNKVNSETIDNTLRLINEVASSIGRTFWTKETEVAKMLNSMKNYINNTIKPEHVEFISNQSKSELSNSGKQFTSQINDYLATLKSWSAAVNNDPENSPEDKQQAGTWIKARVDELNELWNRFKPDEADGFLIALNKSKFIKEKDQFKKVWIE